jgi:type IX secretion system PorP/SprF family membrane protein
MIITKLKMILNLKDTMKYFIWCLLGLSMYSTTVRCEGVQMPMYSQYMFNMININPAYAGHRGMNSLTALYRNQWTGMKGAPVTTTLSWDRRGSESNVGYGAQLYNDQLGAEITTGLQAFYSYRLPFETTSLVFGLSAGVLNYAIDPSKVDYGPDGTNSDVAFSSKANRVLPTAGFGMLYSARTWYVNFSIPALLGTRADVYNPQQIGNKFGQNFHYFLGAGYNLSVNEYVDLKPSVLLKSVGTPGSSFQADANLTAWFQNTVGVGISYRTNSSIVGMAEFQISNFIRLGYAYDYSTSLLNRMAGSTHEIMLRYEFVTPTRRSNILSPRYY